MDGCILGLILFLALVLYFTLGLRWTADLTPPAERDVDARSNDPAETYRRVMGVADEVHSRWYEGKHPDEVIHLHLPNRAEMAKHDTDVRINLRWLERDAGDVDVVLHYDGEPAVDRRVCWDRVERSAEDSIRRAEWRHRVPRMGHKVPRMGHRVPRMGHKEAGCLPLLIIPVLLLVVVVGVLLW